MINSVIITSSGGTTLPSWSQGLDGAPGNYGLLLLFALVVAMAIYIAMKKIKSNRKGD